MAELQTKDIAGVELLAVGRWKGHNCPKDGCEFTQKMLDQLVTAYDATKGSLQAPVKLGHNDDQTILQADGLPAAGWVTNLRRDGDKLLGDLEKVPAAVADLMSAGAYRTRSAELMPNLDVAGETYPLVFTGLALLGEDLPAVQGLSDITALYQSLHLSLPAEGSRTLVFALPDEEDDTDFAAELETFITRMDERLKGQKGMPAMRAFLRETSGKLRALQSKRQLSQEDTDVDEKAVRTALGLADDADIMEALTALKAKADKPAPAASEVEELKTELSQATARLLTIETSNADKDAEERVNRAIRLGQVLPAGKDAAKRFALRSPEDFDAFIATQPKRLEFGERGVETDETAITLSSAEQVAAKSLGLTTEQMLATKKLEREKAAAV